MRSSTCFAPEASDLPIGVLPYYMFTVELGVV
jgi:hypothetical protein